MSTASEGDGVAGIGVQMEALVIVEMIVVDSPRVLDDIAFVDVEDAGGVLVAGYDDDSGVAGGDEVFLDRGFAVVKFFVAPEVADILAVGNEVGEIIAARGGGDGVETGLRFAVGNPPLGGTGGINPGEVGCAAGDVGGGDLVDGIVHQYIEVEALAVVMGLAIGSGVYLDMAVVGRDKEVADAAITGVGGTGIDIKSAGTEVELPLEREVPAIGGIEVVCPLMVGEGWIESAIVVEVYAFGDGEVVGGIFDMGVTSTSIEVVVLVLCKPDVGVVVHADAVDGWDDAVVGAEVAFNLEVTLCVAFQTCEGGLVGGGGDGAEGVDVRAVGDGPLVGHRGVLPGDGHGGVGHPEGVECV